MLIGKDFDKIVFNLWGFDLVEPNAFIGNEILSLFAIYLAYRIKGISNNQPFFKYWHRFYIVFGVGLFFGGFGHLLWNYWGIYGKIIPWSFSIISIYMVEQAMLSIHNNFSVRRKLKIFSSVKLFISLLALIFIMTSTNVESDLGKGLLVPSINAAIGLIFFLGLLSFYYQKRKYGDFRYFFWGIIIMLPSVVFQIMKINIHPWMDRNDVTHLLMILTITFYYLGIKELKRSWSQL